MIQKTRNYDMFKFRKDNREKISENHVERIYESIKSKNMLEFRPITVNKDFEVIDGQHRLIAAKKLNVEIYYNISEEFDKKDIILLNTSKNWGIVDYLNFYCQNDYPEYLKLRNFIMKNQIQLKIGMRIAMSKDKNSFKKFKQGEFKFENSMIQLELDNAKFIIDCLTKQKGFCHWMQCTRFWHPLIRIVSHPDFDLSKFIKNSHLFMDKINPRATEKGYLVIFQEINNFRNTNKINLVGLEEEN